LACRLVDVGPVVDEACKIINGNRIDWKDLYERACFHRVEPQLAALFEKLPPSSMVPADISEKLKSSVHANLVGQIRYVAEFFRIKDWLDEYNIPVVPYKGFWLGEAMYGNLADRISSDIDLFIDYNDLEKIKQIMTGKGYTGHASLEELTEEYIKGDLAEYNFDRYEEGVCQAHVEFHWRSAMSFYRMGVTIDDLKPQITTGVLQGRDLKVFSSAANLLLVVMHHGGKECYLQMRQVLDIAHLLRRSPDLDTDWLLQQSAKFHVTTLLLTGVRLAVMLTGVAVPTSLASHITEQRSGKPIGNVNGYRIDRFAAGRTRLMAKPLDELVAYKYRLKSWAFKIKSRDGVAVKASLTGYTLRKIIAPGLVPEKLRHHFFNRNIRRR